MFDGPKVEVHITNIHKREPMYQKSLMSHGVTGVIAGLGGMGYALAVDAYRSPGKSLSAFSRGTPNRPGSTTKIILGEKHADQSTTAGAISH
jgi:putative lipase involved disintegration of autophagic bodies